MTSAPTGPPPPPPSTRQRIAGVTVTPVAFKDLPLLNTVGVHEPYAIRAIIEVRTDEGLTGLGETCGDAAHLARLRRANMCVVGFADIAPAVRRDAVGVVLSDHHFWGGLRRSRLLAGICETFGLGLSMHSNSHLGISLAAMTHLAAATPNLTHACDTHWPWKDPAEDVVVAGALAFEGGAVTVPTAPGLGVTLDRDRLGALHEQYLACGLRDRDDTGYMRRVDPSYELRTPRW